MHAEAAWRISTGDGVTVALVDSGVQADADLTGPRLPAVDFTGYGSPETDDDQVTSHGTMMAALINGARGLPGLAPKATLLPLKAVMSRPRSQHGDSDAIRYAADHGAKVLNLSFGLPSSPDSWQEAVRYAVSKDVVVIAAAGNSGAYQSPLNYPAAYPGVLAVSATGPDGRLSTLSTWGPGLGLAAPGARMPLYSRGCTNSTAYFAVCATGDGGTSAAAAYTSAAAALLRSAHPDWDANRVIAHLRNTTRPPHGDTGKYGAGILAPDLALSTPEAATSTAP
ncbi:S8 family serine peptidase [Kitasatospora sp. NPDC050543]|uniref:S8 family serine peptidase n=1 Tax=Kitasatospora sp. NPDC050543 TaxID=3364054 RepID=UPI00378E67A2